MKIRKFIPQTYSVIELKDINTKKIKTISVDDVCIKTVLEECKDIANSLPKNESILGYDKNNKPMFLKFAILVYNRTDKVRSKTVSCTIYGVEMLDVYNKIKEISK